MGFMEFIKNDMNQRRTMYFLVTIIATIPLLTPLGLPVPINTWTQQTYNAIEALPPGSKVIVSSCIQIPSWPEMEGPTVAILKHLFKKEGIKIVIASFYTDGPQGIILALNQIDTSSKTYGVDWVHLPYIAGVESALAGVGADIRKMTKVDFYNTPLDDLPLMKDINSIKDFDFGVLLLVGQTPGIEEHLRQWTYPYGLKITCMAVGIALPLVQQYYAQGLSDGYVASVRGGAEYEALLGSKGKATAATESLSATHIFLIVLVFIGNVQYLRKKYSGGKTK
jgi:hypothetical protein